MSHLLWETRRLDLDETLNAKVYIPEERCENLHVEFSLNDVTAWVWMAKNNEKRRDKLRASQKKIEAIYESMFSTCLPKPRQCMFDKDKDQTQPMMYERTVNSKHLAALLCLGVVNQDFGEAQVLRTASLLSSLLTHLCRSQGLKDETVQILYLGGGGQTTQARLGGRVTSKEVWSEVIRGVLEEHWMQAASDPDRPWIHSTWDNMSIPEFVLLGLDAFHCRVYPFIRVAAQDVLKQVFAMLTSSTVDTWTSEQEATESKKHVGTTSKIRRGVRIQGYFRACQFIANGDVSSLH